MSIDPRMTIRNPTGPGSANHVRESTSISRSEETTSAPTTQYLDIGTPPHYSPAPNLQSILFVSRSGVDQASPTRGIPLPSLLEEDIHDLMEAADDTPLALTPAGQADNIALEFHWPGYMRYSVQVPTACLSRVSGGQVVRRHISRARLAQAVAEHACRFVRMALWETHAPPPVPLGLTSAPGVTTSEMLLRSLDPLISPEGRVVWVPHFVVRYPLGRGYIRPICQRTRW